MTRGRIGYPIRIIVAGHEVELLVKSEGKGGRITVDHKLLDTPPPRSEDDHREGTKTESRAAH